MRRDLSTIDRNIGQKWSRIIQEAFAHGITNDLIFGGLVAGQTSLQALYVASAIKNCSLGTRRITWDGRVFRYAKAGANLVDMKHGVKGFNKLVTEKAAICSAAAKDAKTLVVTFNGDFWDAALGVDELYGGYISLYRNTDRQQRLIVGNTAVKASGGECTLTLNDALTVAIEASDECEILANPYSDVRNTPDVSSSVLGMPAVLATEDQYFWIQSWGTHRITPSGGELGQHAGERQFVFTADGSVRALRDEINDAEPGYSQQLAGFLIERTVDGTEGCAAPFIMLQISP